MEMNPVISARFVLVFHKISRIPLFLTNPAAPEILNAFLVPSGADDSQGMEINGALDDIGGGSLLSLGEDRVALQQDILEQEVLIRFTLDATDA